MTTITFDTLKFSKRLTEAGATKELAEALVEVQKESLSEILDTQVATKQDAFHIEQRLTEIKGEIKLVKWMLGLSLALSLGVVSLLIKIALKTLN